eukprot:2456954-Pleurochrysis_carterae.AAC.1
MMDAFTHTHAFLTVYARKRACLSCRVMRMLSLLLRTCLYETTSGINASKVCALFMSTERVLGHMRACSSSIPR